MIDIPEIYDAAFDRAKIPKLLQSIVDQLGAQCGFIGWTNLADKSGFEVQVGNDPAYLQSYGETYWQHDTLRPLLYETPEDKIAQARDLLADPEIRAGIFYKEWLAPQQIVDNLAINIFKRPELIATLAILRRGSAPTFSGENIAALERIVPHLKRVIYIQSRLVQGANLVGAYRQVMQNNRNGLVLLNEAMTVVDAAGSVHLIAGLAPGQMLKSGALEKAMLEAIETGAPVAVTLSPSDSGKTLLCVPQAIEADSFGDLATGPGIRHAVHVIGVDQSLMIAFDAMSRLYGLTATEGRVMGDVLVHADIKSAGSRLSMGGATVRTHLHRIYDKTSTSGLTGLALLAHRFALPGPGLATNLQVNR